MEFRKEELAVMAAFVIPVLYVFFKWEFSILFLVGIAAAGIYIFNDNFVNKKDREQKRGPSLGPQNPVMPPQQWSVDGEGNPIPPRPVQPPYGGVR